MKRKLQIINGLILLMGIACLYMAVVLRGNAPTEDLVARIEELNARRFINLSAMYFLIIILVSQELLWNYKLQNKICGAINIFLLTVYLFFFTPTNAIVLGVSLAVIGLINCLAVYFWVRYKKIPSDVETKRSTYEYIFNRFCILFIVLLAVLMLIH